MDNKEKLLSMINAIAAGNKESADEQFHDVMKEKTFATLDQYKESVAFNIEADEAE